MLNTLLESRSSKAGNQAFAAASATVHGTLIIIAAFATGAGARAVTDPEEPAAITWITPQTTPSAVPASPARTSPPSPLQVTPVTQVSLTFDVPSTLPAINIPLGAMPTADFPQPVGSSSSTSSETPAGSGPGDGRRAYTSDEVEVPVSALPGGVRPEYPPALRSSGMEGQVVAQFIVDESGHVPLETVKIISATSDLFAYSVRRAIPKMRFAAARIGQKAVPQMVQQLFVFRLDR